MFRIKKNIEVDVILFKDGTQILVSDIKKFLNEFHTHEWLETIDCDDNWTSDYIYFHPHEKDLEKKLLENNVIRLSPYYKNYNDRVAKGDRYHDEYRYWLSEGIREFSKFIYHG